MHDLIITSSPHSMEIHLPSSLARNGTTLSPRAATKMVPTLNGSFLPLSPSTKPRKPCSYKV